MSRCRAFIPILFATIALWLEPSHAVEPKPEDIEFFEAKVRPILATRCFKCHGATEPKAHFRLDSRAGMLKGGDTGPAIAPGKPEESLLVEAIHYGGTYQMPPDGKLKADEIAALTRWVKIGAPWPDGDGPAATKSRFEFNLAERRKHWSFQPIRSHEPPAVKDPAWPRGDIDRFILARLEAAGLRPAREVDRATWLRRVTFALIGLPPEPAEVEAFERDRSPEAYAKAVDRLLGSPHFGEHWARHWLDLVRYAESRGHEFDYDLPNAWQYRDYVIRAFNADVPYNQFVVEHLAGDLLGGDSGVPPRLHPKQGFNESILGTGFWFLGEWVHSPVDIKLDEAERFDNMIDVATKTFCGLTVACARCHDHKFDAITQADYYALYGFLRSSEYRQVCFDTLEHNRKIAGELTKLRREAGRAIAAEMIAAQRPVLNKLADYLLAAREGVLLGPEFDREKRAEDAKTGDKARDIVFEDFEGGTYGQWKTTGTAFGDRPQTLATIASYQGRINAQGKLFVNSHNVRGGEDSPRGDAHVGTLTSPKFRIERDFITFLVGGGSHAGKTCVNLLVDGKPVLTAAGRNNNQMFPHRWDVRAYRAREAQIEVVDQEKGGWGNIGLDHIVFTNQPGANPDGSATAVRRVSAEDFTPAYRAKLDDIARARGLSADVLARCVAHSLTARGDASDPLHAWSMVAEAKDADQPGRAAELLAAVVRDGRQHIARADEAIKGAKIIVDYSDAAAGFWQDGFAFGAGPVRPGDVLVSTKPAESPLEVATRGAVRRDPAFAGLKLAPGTQTDGGRLGGLRSGQTFRTPTFTIETGKLFYLVAGPGRAYAAVDSHRMNNGPLHGELVNQWPTDASGKPRWIAHHLPLLKGHRGHLEFTPEGNADLQVLMVVQAEQAPGNPLDRPNRLLLRTAEGAGAKTTPRDLAAAYAKVLTNAADQLARGELSRSKDVADEANLANWLVGQQSWLAAAAPESARSKLVAQARSFQDEQTRLAGQVRRESHCAPAMWEGPGQDERLFIRGNPKTLGPVVPRRFLQALTADNSAFRIPNSAFPSPPSGRLELARHMTDPARNPFITRVMVNRVWHYLIGRGIVESVDNFGVLGKPPTHPELLDHLATSLAEDGWSLKRLVRRIALSSTYRMASHDEAVAGGSDRAEQLDPNNLLLHRMNVRRLEAESIRDAMLAVSGRLDRTAFGPSVPVHLTAFMQGRGRPGQSGPLDGAGRRSLYVSIRRNFLSPMMLAFDAPIPFTTMGRRNVSNVPAQALILMNDPLVIEQAGVWAKRALAARDPSPAERITAMYRAAFARPPSEEELQQALAFLESQAKEQGLPSERALADPRVWTDLAHVLWNVKEFVFVP